MIEKLEKRSPGGIIKWCLNPCDDNSVVSELIDTK